MRLVYSTPNRVLLGRARQSFVYPGDEEADGTLIIDVPLLDESWAVRRVLRYGPDAVVESPDSLRARIRAQLELLSGQ